MRLRAFHPLCIALLFVTALLSLPARSADTAGEIDHLLHYIASSGCTFLRNDTVYDAEAAKDHIAMKYEYAKRWVKSAEDFIRLTATQSSVTGRSYMVHCDGEEMLSGRWLQQELERYRAGLAK